jgi:hypothetical protein
MLNMLMRWLSLIGLVLGIGLTPLSTWALSLAEIDSGTLSALTGSPVDALSTTYDFIPEVTGGDGVVTSQVFAGAGAAAGNFVYVYSIELYPTPPASVGAVWGMRWSFNEMPVDVVGIGESFFVGDDGGTVAPVAASWSDGELQVAFIPAIGNGDLSHAFGFVSPNAPDVTIANLIDSGAIGGTAAVLSNGTLVPEPSAALVFGIGLLIVAPAVSRWRR